MFAHTSLTIHNYTSLYVHARALAALSIVLSHIRQSGQSVTFIIEPVMTDVKVNRRWKEQHLPQPYYGFCVEPVDPAVVDARKTHQVCLLDRTVVHDSTQVCYCTYNAVLTLMTALTWCAGMCCAGRRLKMLNCEHSQHTRLCQLQ